MNFFKLTLSVLILSLVLINGNAHAKADTVDLYAHSVMTCDIPELEKILAPNFWYIGSNGHIMDKENFLKELANKEFVVDRVSLRNQRETRVGETRIITANGVFYGKSIMPRPQGLMRYTIVVANNMGTEQIVLVQLTPVVASRDCVDGNCLIK